MLPAGNGPFRLLFDATLMRPGCALLQAIGGDWSIASAFDTATWLTAPTSEMRTYSVTREQLKRLVEKVHEKHAETIRVERAKIVPRRRRS